MKELVSEVEQAADCGAAAEARPLPADALACPLCGRMGALTLVGDVLYCAACGYASDGVRGCT